MRKLIFAMSCCTMFAACSQSGVELPNQEDGKIPINITTNITRATDTAFENGDKVGLFVVNVPNALKVSGNHADNICHTYSGSWTAKTPIYWLDESTKADFYCYYPYSSTISNVDAYPFSVRGCAKGTSSSFFLYFALQKCKEKRSEV